jgi:predicted ATPase/class 3 adenylate cyclase/Tfp pilus assembly protein PilF
MNAQRTLLLTDVVDSTQLAERLGDAAAAELSVAHDRVARDLLRQWRGREIDKTDGMLMLFEHPADAVGFALAYHAALAGLPVPLKARAGLHVGAVILRANPPEDVAHGAKPLEVEGIAKPIAARVMSLAMGGQTLLTSEARAALGDTTLRVQSHGHWRIKGIVEPVELFEVGDERAPFVPPPDSAKVYRVIQRDELWLPVRDVAHSLPAERDAFVGRQDALAELARRFDAGARLVSVLGIGGTGKTRLAVRFARIWMGEFPGGVWFCDLSQARTTDGILQAVAQALDVPLGHEDPVRQLGYAIAAKDDCLVILDNFEQVSRHADETLGPWLDRAGKARFLVTTREVLGLRGEEALALPPLDPADSATLFVCRAMSARQDFVLHDAERDAVAKLVRLLDGLPLAIELAAARVRVMPPQAVLDRMGQRFQLLAASGGRRDRQATLRAAFDWSWDLLVDAEKAALAQLSVFEGGFSLEAAERVLDLSACRDDPWVPAVLQMLVDKSFVRAAEAGRFGLLSSVQDYAAARLRTPRHFPGSGNAGEAAAVERHRAYFARASRARPSGIDEGDLDNVIVACRRAVVAGDVASAAATLSGAWALLQRRGPLQLGAELAGSVMRLPVADLATRGSVAHVAGCALDACGRVAEAEQQLQAALHDARAAGDVALESRVLNSLGTLSANQARLAAARDYHEAALDLARRGGERSEECAALSGLGTVLVDMGRTQDARQQYEAALRAARETGNRRWECGVLSNLGGALFNLGDLDAALRHFEQARDVARELRDRVWEGNALCNLGALHHAGGRLDEALAECEAALSIARAIGHVRLECVVHCNLGLVFFARQAWPAARIRHETALSLARELGDRRSEGLFLGYLGQTLARQGAFEEARSSLDQGEAILQEVADRFSLGLIFCHRAEVEHLAGEYDAAALTLQAAQAIADEVAGAGGSELAQALAGVQRLMAPEAAAANEP